MSESCVTCFSPISPRHNLSAVIYTDKDFHEAFLANVVSIIKHYLHRLSKKCSGQKVIRRYQMYPLTVVCRAKIQRKGSHFNHLQEVCVDSSSVSAELVLYLYRLYDKSAKTKNISLCVSAFNGPFYFSTTSIFTYFFPNPIHSSHISCRIKWLIICCSWCFCQTNEIHVYVPLYT